MHLRLMVLATATSVAAVSAGGCSTTNSSYSVSYQRYAYTCCDGSDIQRTWHPGETFTLHWTVEPAGTTADSAGQRVTLTAVLTGPYQSVAALKAGSAALLTLRATPMVTTDQTNAKPVSSIALPMNLPAGFYNVTEGVEFTNGSTSSASIIQVQGSLGSG